MEIEIVTTYYSYALTYTAPNQEEQTIVLLAENMGTAVESAKTWLEIVGGEFVSLAKKNSLP